MAESLQMDLWPSALRGFGPGGLLHSVSVQLFPSIRTGSADSLLLSEYSCVLFSSW